MCFTNFHSLAMLRVALLTVLVSAALAQNLEECSSGGTYLGFSSIWILWIKEDFTIDSMI